MITLLISIFKVITYLDERMPKKIGELFKSIIRIMKLAIKAIVCDQECWL